ncbi:MAG: outer membrane protein assembly factor BamD [Pseudomonadota bacterium]
MKIRANGTFTSVKARILGLVAVMGMALAVTGCAGMGAKDAKYIERPVEEIYNTALKELQKGRYFQAAEQFDEVERQHPYSVWARRSMLMAAYSNYQINEYDKAILAAQRFISLHPGNRDVVYAYYLVAISYYEQISDVGRDQKITAEALRALTEVVRRFPTSDYARDARLKIDLTNDHLAGKEMEIGRYYLKQHEYLAAINRFRIVVESFQTTSHVPEALHRLTESYVALGIIDEAQSAAAVLGYNYPGSDWYQDSYSLLTGKNIRPVENKKSWISRAFGGIS